LDINGDFLRGMYLGHTGKRTEAVIQYSQGMVLFVDEAYLLQQDDSGDNFGQEAIGVLLDAMEKYRKNFVVIFAGYDKEMNIFLNANSGLRSRISKTFHFKSYTANELAHMMQNLAKKDHFRVEKPVWIPLQRYLKTRLYEPHFGNARFIRSFWEETKASHIMNVADGKYSDDMKYVITLDDVEPLFSRNIQAEPKS
jgi:replication-associated recombination protein RarA